MSQANVDLVRLIQPSPDVDIAALFRDDVAFGEIVGALQTVVHEDFEAFLKGSLLRKGGLSGAEGLREAWLDWLEPWESYRTEVEDVLDAGEDVVVLVRDFARRRGADAEVALTGAAIWTVRDGKLARAVFYPDRSEALEAAGLQK